MLVTLRKAFGSPDQKVIHNQPSPFQTSRIQAPGHPKYKFLPLRMKFGQHFTALKGTEEVDQLRREARKGRKWSFVGKGKDRQQRKEKLGRLPHGLGTPRSRWEALRLSQGTTPQAKRGAARGVVLPQGTCPSLPPNVEPGGPRSRGERIHFPISERTPCLGSPAGRSILTWGTRPTAAPAVRTTGLAALTRAPPRPGAGPQLYPVDLSLSSRELASPPPGARSRCPPARQPWPLQSRPSLPLPEATPTDQSEAVPPNFRQ